MKVGDVRIATTIAAALVLGSAGLAGCAESNTVQPAAPPVDLPVSAPASPTSSAKPGAAEPSFLSATDLPTGDRYGTWNAQGEESGLPDPEYFCITGELPADETEYQTYGSDLDAEVRQFIVSAESGDEAEDLVETLNTAVDGCVERYAKAFPVDEVSGEKYGEMDLGEGVTLAGRFFAPKDSEYSMQLYAVGRSGSTVTVVVLGQMDKAAEAPLDAFKSTVTAAMGKLGAGS